MGIQYNFTLASTIGNSLSRLYNNLKCFPILKMYDSKVYFYIIPNFYSDRSFFFRLWWVDPCFTLDPATQPSICRSSYSSAKTLIIISSDLPCYEGNLRFTTVPLKSLCYRRVERYFVFCVCRNFTDSKNH